MTPHIAQTVPSQAQGSLRLVGCLAPPFLPCYEQAGDGATHTDKSHPSPLSTEISNYDVWSGNVPIECLSVSPWTAAIMASDLLIENKDQEDDDVDSDNGSSTGMDDHSAELRTQLLRKKGIFFFHWCFFLSWSLKSLLLSTVTHMI